MTLIRRLASAACVALALTGCRDKTEPVKAADGTTAVTLQLNWQPEPQFGGFYQAAKEFEKHNLKVDVRTGGGGTPTIQQVGKGEVEFAIVSADEIILARQGGNDVVALFAVYQDCPQGIMTRQSKGFKKIDDVFAAGGTLAIEDGLPYVDFLQKKYDFSKVKIVPSPGGSLALFRADENYSQQCFITSEPLAAKAAGIETKTFLIAETGYNPYTTVLATSRKFYDKNPKLCADMVASCRAGWAAYLADPSATNTAMRKLRPDMDEKTFTLSAEVQKPLIDKSPGLGVMTAERWTTLADQLKDLGVVREPLPGTAYFVDLK